MDFQTLSLSLLMVGLAMYVIKYACDSFEEASEFLGKEVYKMKPGIRGATLEAIGSSLPELFTTLFLLFVIDDVGGFSAGIATCAGSAVFNAAVIPGICVLAVTIRGVKGESITAIPILKSTIIRDGTFFLLAEIVLIIFLSNTQLAWWMGASLIVIYFLYFGVLMKGMGGAEADATDDDENSEEGETQKKGFIKNILTFDYNELFFGGKGFNANSAWVVLIFATGTIGAACYFLAEAIHLSADALDVPMFFTAVILGAAATSVPDTFISYKDALKGDYDDAVANAVGSNIFDICVALGLPLMIYGLVNGPVTLIGDATSGAAVQELRVALVAITTLIIGIFVIGKNSVNEKGKKVLLIGNAKGWFLCSIYLFWTAYIVVRAMDYN